MNNISAVRRQLKMVTERLDDLTQKASESERKYPYLSKRIAKLKTERDFLQRVIKQKENES